MKRGIMMKRKKNWNSRDEGCGPDADETNSLVEIFADRYGIRPTEDGLCPAFDAITPALRRSPDVEPHYVA